MTFYVDHDWCITIEELHEDTIPLRIPKKIVKFDHGGCYIHTKIFNDIKNKAVAALRAVLYGEQVQEFLESNRPE